MEAMQQRFGRLQLKDREPSTVEALGCLTVKEVDERERQILRCAPPFDAQAEHEKDLEYESRVDYESWQYDGPEQADA